jgi:hypothetical protein
MQRSWAELKNCSIWLRNSIGDVRLESEKPRGGKRGAGKRRSILLSEHDGEDAKRLLGIGRIFRPEFSREIEVIDLPEEFLALELERAEVVLAVRIVVRVEVVERPSL